MNHKNTTDNHPYLCPGCETPLDTATAVAVAHMTSCESLQQMIVVARYAHALRNKTAGTGTIPT
jgi:hypothetical protein